MPLRITVLCIFSLPNSLFSSPQYLGLVPSLKVKVKMLVTQLCPILCDPKDPLGSSVHGNLQARILEWVAIPFSRGSFQLRIEPRSPALQAESSPSEPLEQSDGCLPFEPVHCFTSSCSNCCFLTRTGFSRGR